MHDATPLIATIVGGLVLAFFFGAIAHRLRLPILAGYLLAGVVAGPFTPGYVADAHIAQELADLGVILLMFGVGLHFSVKDLMAVKAISIPGAAVQMAVATALGMLLGWALGWPLAQGFVFGLALSVASTVVLLRAIEERRLLDTDRGRIAVGWLIVEDLAMVLALVLLPAIAGFLGAEQGAPQQSMGELAKVVAFTFGKVALFIALMLVVGKRLIPWVLQSVAQSGSRELFRLAVLAIALGVAFGAARLFDVSFELGAFFAGMMMGESKLSQQAAEETLPLRDAFAVLFFVSIGMLFNPGILLESPWIVLAACLIIIVGKFVAAFVIVRAFGRPLKTALTISVSLAQIGEFSFILAGLGVSLGLLSAEARDVLLAAAIVSILVNPLLFVALDRWVRRAEAAEIPVVEAIPDELEPQPVSALKGHAVLVGFGRVGRRVFEKLRKTGQPILVIETDEDAVRPLREHGGAEVVVGNAASGAVLAAANLAQAASLIVAVPNPFEAGQIVRSARAERPDLDIVARAHSEECVEHLASLGASRVIYGEQELARSLFEASCERPSAPPVF
ncbi:Kef-type potassium/proton antiporter (CPA2 family) [Luteibacter rhizovicinus]|uniref:Kef-type potassium/proton antiporter (CPA2 family) n=1 Tax=Luteibacter rhizovicinus TaxID=242606 RepID=A0A4R3YP53_9GAMM|nr:YbaL family putative K(+) efflux transporter [Luteibacter rhizovicinus]TCV94106.1 Kef-type potassium/proton antiporter (CPA2 family) [Luteibacter rhizovicinus]